MPSPELEKIEQIYALYDTVIDGSDMACRKGCAGCCTCNVTLTGLEARFLLTALDSREKQDLVRSVRNSFPRNRYCPDATWNGFAAECISGGKSEAAGTDPAWGQCPLLENALCSVYPVRPFGCRCLWSDVDCRQSGYARMAPFVLTLNNVFLQYIEHLDCNGISGNLSDMLLYLSGNDNTGPDGVKAEIESNGSSPGLHLIDNRPIPALMVPPEHRKRIMNTVNNLNRILAPK